ncbi:MAG TPA: GNAT family N-acetyltransferase [Caulobacteraceae bacterium]|jgi:ribosomal protein S18 acetylase RimI-like enzyme|nr:GNAT family N-acetyltransferase [Caulobacteraceae bacterium]
MSDAITVFDLEADLKDVRALMSEYGETLDVRDRCFQNMDAELEGLPGEYAPPHGALFVARSDNGEAVGCIALHGVADGACEMKRLYVKPSAQGRGLGRRLAATLIGEARRLGFRAMRLDTFEAMTAARGLYADLGFRPIAPYNDNPMPGLIYLELVL